MPDELERLSEAMLGASRALVGIAVRGLEAVAPEMTVAQHRVLLLIDRHGGLSVNDIADLLAVNQSNASRHTSRLVELGLVARHKVAHDARAVSLRLTDAGRARVQAVRRARLVEIRSVLARMDIIDVRSAAGALRAFEKAAEVSVAHDGAAVVH
jgi:DNA-binding MarR family transcriptional regulator